MNFIIKLKMNIKIILKIMVNQYNHRIMSYYTIYYYVIKIIKHLNWKNYTNHLLEKVKMKARRLNKYLNILYLKFLIVKISIIIPWKKRLIKSYLLI